jgi:hypothetical protein
VKGFVDGPLGVRSWMMDDRIVDLAKTIATMATVMPFGDDL